LFAKELLPKDKFADYKNVIILVAFSYELLPFYPPACLSGASIPLLVYLPVLIYKDKKKFICYALMLLYPILSSLVFYEIFILAYLFIFALYDLIKNKRFSMIIAFIILVLGYIAVEYRLLYTILIDDTISIRESFIPADNITIQNLINTVVSGHYHASSIHGELIFPLGFI